TRPRAASAPDAKKPPARGRGRRVDGVRRALVAVVVLAGAVGVGVWLGGGGAEDRPGFVVRLEATTTTVEVTAPAAGRVVPPVPELPAATKTVDPVAVEPEATQPAAVQQVEPQDPPTVVVRPAGPPSSTTTTTGAPATTRATSAPTQHTSTTNANGCDRPW